MSGFVRPPIVERALRARAAIMEATLDPAWRDAVGAAYVRQVIGRRAIDPAAVTDDLCDRWVRSMRVGEVYAVTEQMFHLVNQAGEELPREYVAEHHHLHAEHGFIWLPLALRETNMEIDPCRYITWHHGTGTSPRAAGKVAGIEINYWNDESGLILPVGSDFLPYGMPALGLRTYGSINGKQHEQYEDRLSNGTRFVLALQMLMRQELPTLGRFAVPRSTVRHLRRLDLPNDPVVVVDLRRRKYVERDDVEPSGRHQMVRSIVRGHWRSYWVGPTHPHHPGDTDAKVKVWMYVAPYWRGPEDGPLKLRDTTVNLVRR